VFGRPLRDCVAETAVVRTIEITSRSSIEKRFRNSQSESHLSELGAIAGGRGTVVLSSSVMSIAVEKIVDIHALEERRLPALALRCAQHLVKWGIQEEGLFRYVAASSLLLVNITKSTTVQGQRPSSTHNQDSQRVRFW
jgi:hypothetical protein